jgi:AAA ATPase domain
MDVEVTVSNYRCFSDKPVRFALKKGLQAFVGVNNSGKSCLLRLFYELRNVFTALSGINHLVPAFSSGGMQPYSPMPLVKDAKRFFAIAAKGT